MSAAVHPTDGDAELPLAGLAFRAPAGADEDTRAALLRIHVLGIERENALRSLEADMREAAGRGEHDRATLIRRCVEELRGTAYTWLPRAGRWRIQAPPKLPRGNAA